jgi:predicted ATP-grasp superfamily ATP-dependent carboligase
LSLRFRIKHFPQSAGLKRLEFSALGTARCDLNTKNDLNQCEARPFAGLRVTLPDGHARQILPMAKALKLLGCSVTAFWSSRLDLGHNSRWIDRRLKGPNAFTDPNGFLAFLTEHVRAGECDVLIPLVDHSAAIAAEHKPFLSSFAKIAVNDPAVFVKARDKLLTMRACSELGVPAPRTLLEDSPSSDVAHWDLPFPVVVKPRRSHGAIGFSRVDTPLAVQEIIRRTAEKHGPVLVQEYIPQTGLQYKAELMMAHCGIVKAAVVFSKVRWYPLDGGSSTLNVTVHRPDIVDICSRLLAHLGWIGYADVDLIEDPRDRAVKVMEINPRITGSVKIAFQAGVDFAELVVRQCLGQDLPSRLDYQAGVYLRYLLPDILWLIKSPSRFSCSPSWFSLKNSTDQIFSRDDLLPGIGYCVQSLIRLLRENR